MSLRAALAKQEDPVSERTCLWMWVLFAICQAPLWALVMQKTMAGTPCKAQPSFRYSDEKGTSQTPHSYEGKNLPTLF